MCIRLLPADTVHARFFTALASLKFGPGPRLFRIERIRKERLQMGFSDVISWIVVGLIAGFIAKLLMPGRDPGGCIVTMLIGIAGAVLAGFLSHVLRIADETKAVSLNDKGFWTKVAFGVVGAILLLAVYRLIAGRRA
jgi:uncharacterized membrane protein YeaQ/YmgE (transglycosylase-associated protein family)